MKKILISVLCLAMVGALLTGCSGSKEVDKKAQVDKPIVLSLAHSANPSNTVSWTYDKFAQLVKEKSKGKIIVEVHGSGTLAGDQTAVDGVKMGTIDIGSSACNNMPAYTSAFLFADLPYIFKSIDASHKVWWGPIGEELKKKVEKDINAKVLFYVDTGGFRVIANSKREIKTPDDLKGIKLRATASPIEIALLKAWGANPTPLPWPEVYPALEQKVVDGEHLHPVWMYEAKHYEALKYLTDVGPAMSNVHVALMSMKAWNSLTPELQKIVLEASKEAQEFSAKADAEERDKILQKILASGLKLYKPNEQEAKQWEEKGRSIWPQFYDKVPKEFIDRVLAAQQ